MRVPHLIAGPPAAPSVLLPGWLPSAIFRGCKKGKGGRARLRKPSPKAGNGNVDGAKFKRIFCRSAVNKNKTSWMRRKSYDFTHTQRASSPGLAGWAFSLELRLSQSVSVCLSVLPLLRRDVGNRQASEQPRGRGDRPADIQCVWLEATQKTDSSIALHFGLEERCRVLFRKVETTMLIQFLNYQLGYVFAY